MIFVAERSLSQGLNAAILSALGVAIGYMGHTMLVILGLASVLAASPVVFGLIQMSGAAYLIFLAVSTLRSGGASFPTETSKVYSIKTIIVQGILTSILNPKGLLFFFALLPQFCEPGPLSITMQILFFGLVTSFLCFSVYSLVGLLVSNIGNTFTKNATLRQLLPKLSGSVLLILGFYMFLQRFF